MSLTQDVLAELSGLTRKTVNGHLAVLARDGLIEVAYGRIRLCDPAGLAAVAQS